MKKYSTFSVILFGMLLAIAIFVPEGIIIRLGPNHWYTNDLFLRPLGIPYLYFVYQGITWVLSKIEKLDQ